MGLFSRKVDVEDLRARRDFEGLSDVLTKSDDGQRNEAVEAIAALNDPAAVAPIVAMMGRLRTRGASYESGEQAIGRLGQAAVEPLVSLVRAGDLTASSQLARLGPSVSLDPLAELSRDPSPDAREAAFAGLSELGSPETRAIVAEAIEGGPGRPQALSAVGVNGGGGDPRIIRAVLGVLQGSAEEREAAMAALETLAKRIRGGEADPGAIPELTTASRHDDAEVRLTAVATLAAAGPGGGDLDPQIAEAMRAALGDESEGVRSVAAGQLGAAGDHHAFDTLVSLLSSANEQVVANAVEGLRSLEDPAALPAIRERIENRSDLSSTVVMRLSSTRDLLKKREKQLAKDG